MSEQKKATLWQGPARPPPGFPARPPPGFSAKNYPIVPPGSFGSLPSNDTSLGNTNRAMSEQKKATLWQGPARPPPGFPARPPPGFSAKNYPIVPPGFFGSLPSNDTSLGNTNRAMSEQKKATLWQGPARPPPGFPARPPPGFSAKNYPIVPPGFFGSLPSNDTSLGNTNRAMSEQKKATLWQGPARPPPGFPARPPPGFSAKNYPIVPPGFFGSLPSNDTSLGNTNRAMSEQKKATLWQGPARPPPGFPARPPPGFPARPPPGFSAKNYPIVPPGFFGSLPSNDASLGNTNRAMSEQKKATLWQGPARPPPGFPARPPPGFPARPPPGFSAKNYPIVPPGFFGSLPSNDASLGNTNRMNPEVVCMGKGRGRLAMIQKRGFQNLMSAGPVQAVNKSLEVRPPPGFKERSQHRMNPEVVCIGKGRGRLVPAQKRVKLDLLSAAEVRPPPPGFKERVKDLDEIRPPPGFAPIKPIRVPPGFEEVFKKRSDIVPIQHW